MDYLLALGAQLQRIPGAILDLGVLNSPEVILDRLNARGQEAGIGRRTLNDAYVALDHLRAYVNELHAWVQPYQLPEDYLFFLRTFGGLGIKTRMFYFNIRGIGLGANGFYTHLVGSEGDFDEGVFEHAMLLCGELFLKDDTGLVVHFFLDLGGRIQHGAVIGIRDTWHEHERIPDLRALVRDLPAHREQWSVVAPSFTQWLELIVATQGTFGYLDSGG